MVSMHQEVRERRGHDKTLLVRNLLIALNACISVILMVAMVLPSSPCPDSSPALFQLSPSPPFHALLFASRWSSGGRTRWSGGAATPPQPSKSSFRAQLRSSVFPPSRELSWQAHSKSDPLLVVQILDLYRFKVLDKAEEVKSNRKPWHKCNPCSPVHTVLPDF